MRCKGIIKTHNSSESCICLWKFNFKDFKGFKGFKEQGAGGKRVVGSRGQEVSLEEQKACEGGIAYHANRIDTQE